jgi:class 3 adenylate cyclase
MNKTDLENNVDRVFGEDFTQVVSDVIPDIENSIDRRLTLGNKGILGDFTFLYVDMRGSSSYTDQHRLQTITKIYKAYHICMVDCIKIFNGRIRSFDGDRVLGVFSGPGKENNALNCAMKMVGCKIDLLQPKIYSTYNNDNFSLGIGISTGKTMVSIAGSGYDKNNRDLIWIGNAPNLGSKLSDEADSPYSIYICKNTYDGLSDINKYVTKGRIKHLKWKSATFRFKDEDIEIYKTGYYRHI